MRLEGVSADSCKFSGGCYSVFLDLQISLIAIEFNMCAQQQIQHSQTCMSIIVSADVQ